MWKGQMLCPTAGPQASVAEAQRHKGIENESREGRDHKFHEL